MALYKNEEEGLGNGELIEQEMAPVPDGTAEKEPEEGGKPEERPGLVPDLETQLVELRDKYLRLYAEFENYKKRVNRDKEDLVKYCNESILYEILPVIDNLEMALGHAGENVSTGLVKGVEVTLREFQRVMEKFGLVPIQAKGKTFDPSVHHAMSQVVRSDLEDKTVVEEYRKGYMFGEKVLRPSLVAVSKKPVEGETEIEISKDAEEE